MYVGIDLGTTISIAGYRGELVTGKKSSSVSFDQQRTLPRDHAGEDAFSSYKTNMTIGLEGRKSIEASAIVLKELSDVFLRRQGARIENAVISVPAYFTTTQREAVYRSAKLANINIKALINEPTAAAIYICNDLKDLVVVFDLGGGTFDVTIIDSRIGIYSVVATDGLVLGGDDLDNAIMGIVMDKLAVPMRYRTDVNKRKVRSLCRVAKEEIQAKGEPCVIGLASIGLSQEYVLTPEEYKTIVADVFKKAWDMTVMLINKHIHYGETPKIVYVGGSTKCPYLKEMLHKNIELEEITYDCDPDLVVALGVTRYAQLLEDGCSMDIVEDVTKQLSIEDSIGMALPIIKANSIIPIEGRRTVFNSEAGDKLKIKLYQGNNSEARQNEYIGTLIFNYDQHMEIGEGVVVVKVAMSSNGLITLSGLDTFSEEEQAIELKLV